MLPSEGVSSPEVAHDEVSQLITVQKLCAALYEAREAGLAEKIKRSPQTVNRASSVGHPCERYLYYLRENWKDRPIYGTGLQKIFDIGNAMEPLIVEEVARAARRIGFRFVGQQEAFEDKEAQLTGHIDGGLVNLSAPDVVYPTEIKTCSPFVYAKIKTVEDILNSEAIYMRSYYAQLQSYLYLMNKQFGIIVLANKSDWDMRFIPVELSFSFYEETLQKCKRVNEAVLKHEPPERNIDFDTCTECAFKEICFDGATLQLPTFNSERLLTAIEEKEACKPSHQMYEKASDVIKEECERAGGDLFKVGNYMVTRKFIPEKEIPATTRKGYYRNSIKALEELK